MGGLGKAGSYRYPEYAGVRSCAARLVAPERGEVVPFEISPASYLVSPYPEENRRQWIRTLQEPELRRLGRSPVANQLEVIRARGAEAQAILPRPTASSTWLNGPFGRTRTWS